MTSAPIIRLHDPVLSVFQEAAQVFKPPPLSTVSQWAERKRMLSSESSSYVGLYSAEIAPYQTGMMDAINIPGVEENVFFTSAQIGKSLCLENMFGYFVDEDPCPIIYMWPTLDVARGWSAETLAPLLRDTPALAEKVTEGGRKTGAGALFKSFPGGWLAVIGAASPAGLRRRRARIIFCEEIDDENYAAAGQEGDPLELVWKRSTTFWNRVRVLASTCTVKGESRIEARYEASNKQKFWVKCPECGDAQVLQWERLSFPKDIDLEQLDENNVVYACLGCGAALHEWQKAEMLRSGEWRADAPEITKIQGFWINELYSPFVKWHQMARAWLEALKERENPQRLKTFVNLSLARTWEEKEIEIDREGLVRRCEDYTPDRVPDGVVVITAAGDVQPDYIKVQVRGWGRGFESWSLEWKRFDGDTSVLRSADPARPSPWEQLDVFLQKEYVHERGVRLDIAATFIDSGHLTGVVYEFTKSIDLDRRVFACKGMSTFDHPELRPHNRNNKMHVRMYPVGVSQIKRRIYQWLRLETKGPGYMHFTHHHNDAEYFDELTVEKLKKRYERGFPVRFWEKPDGARNEALDCTVYSYAALLSLSENPAKLLERLREDLMKRAREIAEERRRKADPNQLALLDLEAALVPPIAPVPIVVDEAVKPETAAEVPAQTATSTADPQPAPESAARLPRIRTRSSWI